MVKLPRGCRDFSPEEMEKRRWLENRLRKVAESFNFREIQMPTFEHSELFIKKSGEEIVRQLYIFEDKSGRSLALRPEMTAQAMRFYSSNFQFEPKPLKFFYFGNCFRYERPQKGRYREFWQFGVEIIGSSRPEAGVELLSLATAMYSAIGLNNYLLRIGNVGILRWLFSKVGLNEEEKKAAFTLLDKDNFQGLKMFLKEKGVGESQVEGLVSFLSKRWTASELQQFRESLNKIIEWLINNNSQDQEEIKGLADSFYTTLKIFRELNDEFLIDLSVARGLDYYTGMVFEIEVPGLGAEAQVCGGGEYSLDSIFEIDSKGTLGFAIGFDRTLLALEKEGVKFPTSNLEVYIVPFQDALGFAFKVLKRLREGGVRADIELTGRSITKAFKYADKIGARYVVVVGEEEVKAAKLTVKNMSTQHQEMVEVERIVEFVRG